MEVDSPFVELINPFENEELDEYSDTIEEQSDTSELVTGLEKRYN